MQTPELLSDIVSQKSVEDIFHLIEVSEKILITAHVSPDGDALGSSLALYHFLLSKGKKDVKIIVPNAFPYFLKWLPGAKEIIIFERHPQKAKTIIEDRDLIFCLDFNVPSRIREMGDPVINSNAAKVLIDHHLHPSDLFDVRVSYPEMSSTCELLFRVLYQHNEYENINLSVAECIYCGMMTDTGAFTYNSSDPEIYHIISLLLKKGIDKDQIYCNVNNNVTEDNLRLLGFILSQRMKVYPEHHAALLYLTIEDQKKFNFSKGDTEGVVNYPLRIKNIIFSTMIREDQDQIKISFRSQNEFSCNEFASEFFNGGGHKNASGGEFYGKLDDAIKLFEEGLSKYKEKLEKTEK